MFRRTAILSELCPAADTLHLSAIPKGSLKGVCSPNSRVNPANLRRATEENNQLVALLKDLLVHVDDCGRRKISESLHLLGHLASALDTAVPNDKGLDNLNNETNL